MQMVKHLEMTQNCGDLFNHTSYYKIGQSSWWPTKHNPIMWMSNRSWLFKYILLEYKFKAVNYNKLMLLIVWRQYWTFLLLILIGNDKKFVALERSNFFGLIGVCSSMF